MADVKRALYFPLFGELAEPALAIDVAVAAEAAGWDGVYVWDHVLRPENEPNEIADPWIVLAAIAAATSRVRLATMVTPLVRRRLIKLAREVVTLDRLSDGRVTLGLGLGVDSGGELSRFGEISDVVARGRLLGEGAGVLDGLLSGERVSYAGEFHTVDDVLVEPRCVQDPRVPMWFAARGDAKRPVRRAARYEGLVPIEVDRSQLASMVDTVVEQRGSLDGFDIAIVQRPGVDVASLLDLGVTWVLDGFGPATSAAELLTVAGAPPDAGW